MGKSKSGWRFSFSVLLPVIVAVLVTVGMAAGFIVWSTAKSDDRALERQTRLMRHILAQEQKYLADELGDVSPSDDAVYALDEEIDPEWVNDNLGVGFFESHGHNRIYVLTPDLKPIYAMRDGGKADASTYEADSAVLTPMARKFMTPDLQSAIDAFENGFGFVPMITDLAVVEGKAALVGITPILGESDDVVVAPGEAYFEIAVRFLDETLATELMDEYLIDGARFASDASIGPGEAAFALHNAAGETVAWFKWLPDRPGAQILTETAPAMGGALLVGGIVIAVLMRRLSRSSAELEQARADAHHRALHDPLTGLVNRAGFQERLGQMIASLGKGRDAIALLALDLDKFKEVNDTLGHEGGDALLQEVGQRLKGLVRETDTVARLGGDEFAILRPDAQETEGLSKRIIASVSQPYTVLGAEAKIGVSIGIATARTDQDGADLLTRADFALYEAKDAGRNCYRVFEQRREDSNVVNLPTPANDSRVA
ncbi:MAG TPA: diguanylate cyclase [Devosia sp.]